MSEGKSLPARSARVLLAATRGSASASHATLLVVALLGLAGLSSVGSAFRDAVAAGVTGTAAPLSAPSVSSEAGTAQALARIGQRLKGMEKPIREVWMAVGAPFTNPGDFRRMGAEAPKAILLYGPPGTGKTTLTRLVAEEAGVGFVATTGSNLLGEHIGAGAKHVQRLFEEAEEVAAARGGAIVFIDEIDGLGNRAQGGNMGQFAASSINELLAHLDGIAAKNNIVVVAATNNVGVLDEALVRAGRFDRKIHIGMPDQSALLDILKMHAENVPFARSIRLPALLERLRGYGPADIRAVVQAAARNALERTLLDEAPEAAQVVRYSKNAVSTTQLERGLADHRLAWLHFPGREGRQDYFHLWRAIDEANNDFHFPDKELRQAPDFALKAEIDGTLTYRELAERLLGQPFREFRQYDGANETRLVGSYPLTPQLIETLWNRFSPEDRMRLLVEAGIDPLKADIGDLVAGRTTAGAGGEVTKADLDRALADVRPSALPENMASFEAVRWGDVGGYEAEKALLRRAIERPLKDPEAFARLGAKASPKSVILFGEPGTGKSLLVKAVATESGANVFAVKLTDLLAESPMEAAKKVQALFDRARRTKPSIILLDEMDAIARVRGHGGDSTLVNAILTEMQGIAGESGVVIVGTTNRLDEIDPAILRSGRFGVHVPVGLPDEAARREILAVHTRGVRTAKGIDYDDLARRTEGMTGADLEALVSEAVDWTLTHEPGRKSVSQRAFDAAVETLRKRVGGASPQKNPIGFRLDR